MSKKWIWGLLALGLSLPVLAADNGKAVVRAAIRHLDRGATVSEIKPSAMPGFYRALVGGRLVYVSHDGRYVLDGRLFDAKAMRNLTDEQMRAIRVRALATLPVSQRLVFAPPHPRYTVTVFTDLDCGYCRAFHQNIAKINAEGIAVQYVFWPRAGIRAKPSGRYTASYEKAVAVWCAADRNRAYTAGVAKPAECANPVAREYRLGKRIGIDATPTVIASDGSVLGGYMSPRELLASLQALGLPGSAGGGAGKAAEGADR